MPPNVVLLLCIIFVSYLLFRVDPRLSPSASSALWVPLIWILVVGTREPSQWFNVSAGIDSLDDLETASSLDMLLYSSLFIAGLLILFRRRVKWGGLMNGNILLILFIVYCGASILWSDYPQVSFKRWVKLVGSVIVALIVATDVNPGEAVQTMLRRWAYILVPFSVVAIKYYPEIGKGYGSVYGEARYMGVALHKNSLGAICLIAGIILLWSYVVREKAGLLSKEIRISHMAMVLMTAWLFLKAQSATALICFGVGALIIVVSRAMVYRGNPKKLSWSTLLGGLGVGFLVAMIGSVASLVSGVGRDATLTGRTKIWELVQIANNFLRWVAT